MPATLARARAAAGRTHGAALALAVLLLAASCASPRATRRTPPPPPTTLAAGAAKWTACGADLDSATVTVPLDYTHPSGPTIGIAVERHRALTAQRIGSLIVNPGGPGESGLAAIDLILSQLSTQLQDRFDIVTFDPRGTGASSPVQCFNGTRLDQLLDNDPSPTTPAGFKALVAAYKAFVDSCAALSGPILAYVGTATVARDLDAIRDAVGDTKLTYLGFSYGTLLGATYADLFPAHVRALALDGAIDPALKPADLADQQSAGFEAELHRFLDDCAQRPDCVWRPGGDLYAAFEAVMSTLRSSPIQISGRNLGIAEATYGVVAGLYDRNSWPTLARGLREAAAGHGALLLSLFDRYVMRNSDGTYANLFAANLAVNCLDQQWPANPDDFMALAPAAQQASPDFGVANIYANIPCSEWPVHGATPPHPIVAAGSPPILVIGSTGDPATPLAWAKSLAGELQHGTLLTRNGDGHTAYGASECIRRAVDAYLISGATPAPNATCPSP